MSYIYMLCVCVYDCIQGYMYTWYVCIMFKLWSHSNDMSSMIRIYTFKIIEEYMVNLFWILENKYLFDIFLYF